MKVKIKKLHDNVQLPLYATPGSAGFDIVVHNFKNYYNPTIQPDREGYGGGAPISDKTVILSPGARLLVGAGYSVEIPAGYELQIRTRSGKALKEGLVILNSPGTIDEDYRGEIGAILCNQSRFQVAVSIGDKIGQAVLAAYKQAEWEEVEVLSSTERGEGGFGSTDNQVRHEAISELLNKKFDQKNFEHPQT